MLCPCCRNISIHAPPRGATRPVCLLVVVDNNFNSRPSARGDEILLALRLSNGLFQFTPLREGRRGAFRASGCHTGQISIHAPPRGATSAGDLEAVHKLFQFTPLREGRRAKRTGKAKGMTHISIHAPPRGATVCDSACADTPALISIHAPPRGATPAEPPAASSQQISIHAPPRGATAGSGGNLNPGDISIHAPPRGATSQ